MFCHHKAAPIIVVANVVAFECDINCATRKRHQRLAIAGQSVRIQLLHFEELLDLLEAHLWPGSCPLYKSKAASLVSLLPATRSLWFRANSHGPAPLLGLAEARQTGWLSHRRQLSWPGPDGITSQLKSTVGKQIESAPISPAHANDVNCRTRAIMMRMMMMMMTTTTTTTNVHVLTREFVVREQRITTHGAAQVASLAGFAQVRWSPDCK